MRLKQLKRQNTKRKGAVAVLAALLLAALFAFAAFSVDTGLVTLTQTEMQNASDAAAMAASQEITAAVYEAGQGEGSAGIDANSIAVANARQVAADVASANGVYINPETDVKFGKRRFDATTNSWPIEWDAEPYNVVKVTSRRDQSDTSLPDGELKLSFGWAVGKSSVPLQTTSIAFVESRDIVLVLDFSGSMNDDSSMKSFNALGQANVESSLDAMWDALVTSNVTWPNNGLNKFPVTGFGGINTYEGIYLSSSDTTTIYNLLGLNAQADGQAVFPYPQAGRNSSGSPKNMPSYNTSEDRWRGYISYVKNKSGPYGKKYGYRTLMEYLQEKRYKSSQSEDLWRTPHYPFHGVKQGATLFCQFLTDLDFGDELGLVSYGGYAKIEKVLDDGDAFVDISSDPITNNYSAVNTIQRHKQAGHYHASTGMGDGIKTARELLLGFDNDPNDDGHARYGARPTMIIMTDGQTNVGPSGWSLPSDWNWADWTDFDDDGNADYSTSNTKKQYSFWEATEAIKRGVTVHTMSIGAGADRDLMEAIAFAGQGVWINVPGNSSVQEMESQILAAFSQIAAKVPPAKFVADESAAP